MDGVQIQNKNEEIDPTSISPKKFGNVVYTKFSKMLDSGFVEFKLDYSKPKDLAIGDAVYSGNFSAGDHVWRIKCYQRGHGTDMDSNGEYLSLSTWSSSPTPRT
jgi:hypothetical protein